ncbi:dipeptide epimerase [Lysobacter helvus]|uniref:Dipeptide epimerase n=2 Tax=Lysobacteraceae TaxID=32033 RepID=A0ABN6FU50_9GAMM|nr:MULTISPECIES: dipeptide epimerase [Lysobacter]BCT92061.1 dipeptide epimerase [Lysobacter caseinilyticus]BCT95214.1 dipeptide epimerase [Lysobacter helvus]
MIQTDRVKLVLRNELLRLSEPFRISGHVFEASPVTLVSLQQGHAIGRGEASGVYYTRDEPSDMLRTLESMRDRIEDGLTREDLLELLPPGGARNALDCALWELEARVAGMPAWQLAGMGKPKPLTTTFTVGADAPEVMAQKSLGYTHARAIKLKLTGDVDLDIARLQAVRAVRPDTWIGVDANQGYVPDTLQRLLPALVEAKVSLLEQPCRRGRERELDGIDRVVPIAADESILSLAELEERAQWFDVVNIKLDKCGGLTEGLLMAQRAREMGLKVMVGNMVGTSLAMAPAFLLGQFCDIVDLDGPLFLQRDRSPGVVYFDGYVDCPASVWGSPDVLL